MLLRSWRRALAIGAVLLALIVTPAPLLPPHRLATAVAAVLGIGWKGAYLVAAVATQAAFYGALGLMAAFTVERAVTPGGRWLQVVAVPVGVIAVALLVRSLRVGHGPVWSSGAIPAAACAGGVWLGLGVLYRRAALAALTVAAALAVVAWSFFGGASTALSKATAGRLRLLVAAAPTLPPGERRFGALLQVVFADAERPAGGEDPVEANRAAILAWGIVAGHERIARFIGLDPGGDLVQRAAALGRGTTLRGREDWSRHYALSAAIGVLEHPLVSDAAGLLKEQLDAHSGGSGFSFGDLAADRAGVRFAESATRSTAAAVAMQQRLALGFAVGEFFPPVEDLPENLTVAQFRQRFGVAGSERYRAMIALIDDRLDGCAALR